MNQRMSKKLRKLINPQDPVSKRTYKRLKKSFAKISDPKAQQDFIDSIENLKQSANIK